MREKETMKARIFGMVDTEQKHRSPAQAERINVTLTEEEVERGMGFGSGLTLGSIDVDRGDGKTARFWVTVRRTNQGRIQAEIRANHAEHETRKHVTGSWLDYEKRRLEALDSQ